MGVGMGFGIFGMGKPPFRREERFKNVRLRGEMLTDARRSERKRLTEWPKSRRK
jgi:hypothetical protein